MGHMHMVRKFAVPVYIHRSQCLVLQSGHCWCANLFLILNVILKGASFYYLFMYIHYGTVYLYIMTKSFIEYGILFRFRELHPSRIVTV